MAPVQKRQRELDRSEELLLRAFGKRVAEYAAKRGISIERLAYEAGVSKGYLYDLVKGDANPSLVILYRIASALDITISKLTDH